MQDASAGPHYCAPGSPLSRKNKPHSITVGVSGHLPDHQLPTVASYFFPSSFLYAALNVPFSSAILISVG